MDRAATLRLLLLISGESYKSPQQITLSWQSPKFRLTLTLARYFLSLSYDSAINFTAVLPLLPALYLSSKGKACRSQER